MPPVQNLPVVPFSSYQELLYSRIKVRFFCRCFNSKSYKWSKCKSKISRTYLLAQLLYPKTHHKDQRQEHHVNRDIGFPSDFSDYRCRAKLNKSNSVLHWVTLLPPSFPFKSLTVLQAAFKCIFHCLAGP